MLENHKDHVCETKIKCLCATCSNEKCKDERILTYCTRCRARENKAKIMCVDYRKDGVIWISL